jgi:hypothetical protein
LSPSMAKIGSLLFSCVYGLPLSLGKSCI